MVQRALSNSTTNVNKLTKTNNETENAIDQPKLFARKHHNHHHHNLNEKENRLSRRTKFFSGSASSLNSESATESQISDNGGFLSNLPHINYMSQKRTTIAEPLSRYDLRPFNSKTSNTAMKTLSQELAEELEVTKDILVKHNMPMNRTLIRVVREYICKYGSVQAFKNAIDASNDEKNKLSAFIASSCSSIFSSQPGLSGGGSVLKSVESNNKTRLSFNGKKSS